MHTGQLQNRTAISAVSETVQQMVLSANAFLASLDSDQSRKAVFSLAADERSAWDYRPVPRRGLPFSEMDSSQQRRALTLLASGLSRRGNIAALGIMSLEKILAGLEGTFTSHVRNPELYFVTIFGEPSADAAWGWRIEGHHLSLNFLVAGSTVACTPNFFGANPAVVPVGSGPLAGFRTLFAEEDAARQLLAALDQRQLDHALIDEIAPADIISGRAPRVRPDDPVGLAASALSMDQRQYLLKLINVYLGRMAPGLADRQMDDIDRQGVGLIHIAWAGSRQPGRPHYYRLQGPNFLVEYDNTQNNANHIHSVWRDYRRDWGDDILRQHYAKAHPAGSS